MRKIICCIAIFVTVLSCAESKVPQMYGYTRSKNFHNINWKDFMIKATWGSHELFKMATPYVVQNYPYGNVSDICTNSLMSYAEGVKNWKRWAIRMFDMTGKIPSSFKRGASIEFGSYDDCVRIDVKSDEVPEPFIGQFCMVHLHASMPHLLEEDTPFKRHASLLIPSLESGKRTLNLHLGLCIPSSCSEEDIHNIISALLKSTNVTASVRNCETNEPRKWLEYTKYGLLGLASLFVLCLIGTLLDWNDSGSTGLLSKNTFRESLKAFSLRANSKELFEKDSTAVEIRRICAVLFMLCVCIIVSNTIVYKTPWKEMRYTSFRDISMAVRFADVFVVAMDAIFFVCGFLSIFATWRTMQRFGGIASLFKEFLKIYIRSTAVNIIAMMFAFSLPLIYYGPLWHQTWNAELERCQHNGLLTLFNAQTLLPINDMCWLHSWFPALGMQFLLASIPLIFLLYNYPKLGFTIGIMLTTAIVTTEFTYTATTLDKLHYYEIIRVMVVKYYSKPLFYLLPYLLGLLAGRITFHFKDQQLPKVLHLVGWILSIALIVDVLNDGNFSKLKLEQTSVDLAKRTLLLCIAIFWIMYASIAEGYVGRILSSGAVWPVVRVTHCAYILHILIMLVREAALKERIYIGKLTLTIECTSHTIVSFMFGMVLHIMIVQPVSKLCQIFMDNNDIIESSDEKKEL